MTRRLNPVLGYTLAWLGITAIVIVLMNGLSVVLSGWPSQCGVYGGAAFDGPRPIPFGRPLMIGAIAATFFVSAYWALGADSGRKRTLQLAKATAITAVVFLISPYLPVFVPVPCFLF